MAGICKAGCTTRRIAAIAGVGRIVLSAVFAGLSVALVHGPWPALAGTVLIVVLWLAPAIFMAADIPLFLGASRLHDCTASHHWAVGRIWSGLAFAAALVTAAGLFAAGEVVPAAILEIYALCRVATDAIARSDFADLAEGENGDWPSCHEFVAAVHRTATLVLLMLIASAAVLATGGAPAWAEAVLLKFLWSVTVPMTAGVVIQSWGEFSRPRYEERPNAALLYRIGWKSRQFAGRSGWWLHNGGQILLIYELSLAGQAILAWLSFLYIALAWALNVEWDRGNAFQAQRKFPAAARILHSIVRIIFRIAYRTFSAPMNFRIKRR